MGKSMVIVFLVVIMLFNSINFISAARGNEPTQQFNKIFLDPFYRQNMEQDIPYSYNLTLNPPDKISEVKSSIVTFQMWLNPTIEFFLKVNGEECNTPSYEVHTTYAGAGEGTIFFDCSNIINQSGIYNITLTPDDDTGAVTGWVDLTYMNDPAPDIQVHGTEYHPEQEGKVFIQLLDGDNLPITDSTCFTSIYYPSNTIWKYQQLMNYLDEGLYVFDFFAPYQAGVYPVSAFCILGQFELTEKHTNDYFDTGTISGGTGWDDNWVLDSCTIQSTDYQTPAYALGCNEDRTPYRDFVSNNTFERLDYSFWYMATSFESSEYAYVKLYDTDDDAFTVATISDTNSDGVWRKVTGSLDVDIDEFNFNGTLTLGMDTSGNLEGNDYYYLDTINLTLSAQIDVNGTEYQIVRGSGEVHVTPEPNEYGVSNEYISEIGYGTLTNETFDGFFYLYYNIISLTKENKTDQQVLLPIWNAFPCESVQGVYLKEEGGSYTLLNYSKILLGNRNDRCAITYKQELGVGQTYEVYINATNYWKTEMLGEYEKAKINREILYDGCVHYQQSQSLPEFQIPIIIQPNVTDEFWNSCQYYFNIFHHFNETLNTRFILYPQGEINFTEDEMGEMEGIYLNLLQEAKLLSDLSEGVLNTWQQGNDYAQIIIGGGSNSTYLNYFANVSGNWINYLKEAEVNTTAIADAVWNYSGNISSNLLTQFSESIWTWTGTISSVITDAIKDTVWTREHRNLTYYNMTDTTNYTRTPEEIWNYSGEINSNITGQFVNDTWNWVYGRYTHGIIN